MLNKSTAEIAEDIKRVIRLKNESDNRVSRKKSMMKHLCQAHPTNTHAAILLFILENLDVS
jgi:hypothetical protein